MNNESIDFRHLFATPFYDLTEPGDQDLVPCPGQQACPPFQEATIVTEPLEPVCTCTPEDHAYRDGGDDARAKILAALRLRAVNHCMCEGCVFMAIEYIEL